MRRMLLLLSGVLLVGGAGTAYFLLLGSRSRLHAHDYREAVMLVLAAKQRDFEAVQVLDGCAPSLDRCRTYAGRVVIQGHQVRTGTITCQERWTHCSLTLADTTLVDEPLPDVVNPVTWRLLELQAQFRDWLQCVLVSCP